MLASPPLAAERSAVDLSVIVVSWNTRDELRRCLTSIDEHTRGIFYEVIVVDNDSCDGSAEMVEAEFPNVHLFRHAENLGFAKGCNTGLNNAGGRHTLLLNPDTVVVGDVLAASVRYLDTHPDVGGLGCRVHQLDGRLQTTCFRDPSLRHLALTASGLARLKGPCFLGGETLRGWRSGSECDVDFVTGCYLMVPRQVVDRVGVLDDSFFFCGEENDWCRRIRQAGYAVRFAPVGDVVHERGVAARKLGARRDLLLSAGIVRFMHKYHGGAAGWTACGLIAFHVTSRAGFWWLRSVMGGSAAARRNARHFSSVVRGYAAVPTMAGLR